MTISYSLSLSLSLSLSFSLSLSLFQNIIAYIHTYPVFLYNREQLEQFSVTLTSLCLYVHYSGTKENTTKWFMQLSNFTRLDMKQERFSSWQLHLVRTYE